MIRIPGPQILMWVLQKIPDDKSLPYPTDKSAIPENAFSALSVHNEEEEKEIDKSWGGWWHYVLLLFQRDKIIYTVHIFQQYFL